MDERLVSESGQAPLIDRIWVVEDLRDDKPLHFSAYQPVHFVWQCQRVSPIASHARKLSLAGRTFVVSNQAGSGIMPMLSGLAIVFLKSESRVGMHIDDADIPEPEALYLQDRRVALISLFVILRLLLPAVQLTTMTKADLSGFKVSLGIAEEAISIASYWVLALAMLMPVVARSKHWKRRLPGQPFGGAASKRAGLWNVVVPSFQLPVSANRQRMLLTSRFALLRRWGGWATLILVIAVVATLHFISTNDLSATVIGGVVIPATTLLFLAWLLSISERRHPARILFLRKFNNADLSIAYRRIAKRELKPYGHLIGLGDKHIRRGWKSYFFAPTVDPRDLPRRVLFFPVMKLLRLYDRVRFGPPYVGKLREFRSLAKLLHQRRRMNWQARLPGYGFIVSTSDDWWQQTIRMMVLSADVIVIDSSEITAGTRWEIESVEALGLWSRVIVITRLREAEAARAAILAVTQEPVSIWTYNDQGLFEQAPAMRAAIEACVHTTTMQRWRLRDVEDLTVVRSVPPANMSAMPMPNSAQR